VIDNTGSLLEVKQTDVTVLVSLLSAATQKMSAFSDMCSSFASELSSNEFETFRELRFLEQQVYALYTAFDSACSNLNSSATSPLVLASVANAHVSLALRALDSTLESLSASKRSLPSQNARSLVRAATMSSESATVVLEKLQRSFTVTDLSDPFMGFALFPQFAALCLQIDSEGRPLREETFFSEKFSVLEPHIRKLFFDAVTQSLPLSFKEGVFSSRSFSAKSRKFLRSSLQVSLYDKRFSASNQVAQHLLRSSFEGSSNESYSMVELTEIHNQFALREFERAQEFVEHLMQVFSEFLSLLRSYLRLCSLNKFETVSVKNHVFNAEFRSLFVNTAAVYARSALDSSKILKLHQQTVSRVPLFVSMLLRALSPSSCYPHDFEVLSPQQAKSLSFLLESSSAYAKIFFNLSKVYYNKDVSFSQLLFNAQKL